MLPHHLCYDARKTLERENGRPVYELLAPLVRPDGRRLEIGFRSDLASVPQSLWWYFPPNGDYDVAAWFHDGALKGVFGEIPRKEADRQFRRDLKEDGIDRFDRWWLYLGVRIGTLKAFINQKVTQWLS